MRVGRAIPHIFRCNIDTQYQPGATPRGKASNA
jgi:hypothetical protein